MRFQRLFVLFSCSVASCRRPDTRRAQCHSRFLSQLSCVAMSGSGLNHLHNSDSANKVVFVESNSDVEKAAKILESCSEIGVDLEFDRDRYSYGFSLCLIQVFGDETSYIFDPITVSNLRPLFQIFENKNILKILHSPGEDIRLLHQFECFPRNLFDTEVAAKLLNFSSTSLSSLLSTCLDVQLDKSQQKSNWLKRPLTPAQLVYAANDVIYLPKLKNILLEKALQKDKKIPNWILMESKAWDTIRFEEKTENKFVSKDDIQTYNPYELYILNEVLRIRDKYAYQHNKPGHYIISKDTIVDIIFNEGNFKKYLKNFRNIHPIMRTPNVLKDFQDTLDQAETYAIKNNHIVPEPSSQQKQLDKVKYEMQRLQLANIMKEKYDPVYNLLVERYGEFCARHILNKNTRINLAKQEMSLQDIPFEYRQELFKDIIHELKLEMW
eukprot:gene3596-7148_t